MHQPMFIMYDFPWGELETMPDFTSPASHYRFVLCSEYAYMGLAIVRRNELTTHTDSGDGGHPRKRLNGVRD